MKEEGKEGIPSIRRLWAQDIAFQGNRGRQSRKMMEVEHSASSGCFGASERRRETSTTGGVEEEDAFLAYEEAFLAYMEEQERACGHLDGEWMRLDTDGMETVHFERGLVYNGLEEAFLAYVATDLDGYFVFEYGDGDRVRAKQEGDTLEWSDGAIYYRIGNVLGEGDAISGGDAVLASGGDKYESFTGDGTFYDANVGGDNDEKYEEDLDFSIAEASPATCESDPMFGMSFANVNIERIFLYFHYEFVKRDFG